MQRRLKHVVWGTAAIVAMGATSYAAEMEGVMQGLKGVEVKGYVEASYNYNLNDPDDGLNRFRVFDTKANGFAFNMAELALTKLPQTGAGFGLVLNYGLDAQVTSAGGSMVLGNGSTTSITPLVSDDFDVQQAYVAYAFAGGSAWWRLGKFATLHGAEVIEGPSNYNISRSLLFGYAIPFTHTGLRLHYEMGPMLSGHLGVNNGWDNVRDDGEGKTGELQIGLALPDMIALSVTGMYGPETTAVGEDVRSLVDLVLTLKPIDTLAIVLNYDVGSQTNGLGAGSDANWSGLAAYVNVGVGEKHSVTLRGEIFDDEDGFRTTVAQTLKEVTLTFACKMLDGLEWRAEYRYDMSDVDAFIDSDGVAQDTQSTVALAAYYTF